MLHLLRGLKLPTPKKFPTQYDRLSQQQLVFLCYLLGRFEMTRY